MPQSEEPSWYIDKYLTEKGYDKYHIPKHLCVLSNGHGIYLLYDTFTQRVLWDCHSEQQTEVTFQMFGFWVRNEAEENKVIFENLADDNKEWKKFKYEKVKKAKETVH